MIEKGNGAVELLSIDKAKAFLRAKFLSFSCLIAL
jgi:hypothetical protein